LSDTPEIQTKRIEQTPEVDKLMAAMVQAQGVFPVIEKSAKNPFFNSMYADLEEVINGIRKPLHANGLTIIHLPMLTAKGVGMWHMLGHTSGQYIRFYSEYEYPPVKEEGKQANQIQKAGGAISYMKRYAILAICNLATSLDPDDNDGNDARQQQATASTRQVPPDNSQEQPAPLKVQIANAVMQWSGVAKDDMTSAVMTVARHLKIKPIGSELPPSELPRILAFVQAAVNNKAPWPPT
jgi:hypothetical protein